MNSNRLKIVEATFLVLTILLINIFLHIPSLLVSNTGSSTLINIIYISIITIIFFYIVNFLISKFPGFDMIDISGYLGGKILKILVCIIYILFLLITTAIIIRLFSESISLIYFSHLNNSIVILIFILAAGIINHIGNRAIYRLNIFVIPIMLLSIVFLFFSSFNNYTFERIFPILGYGFQNTFVNGLSNIFSFGGIFMFFLIFPLLGRKDDFKKIGVISIIIYSVFLLLAVSSLLFSFPQVSNTTSPLSLYLLARQITLGEFIQSIDAFFLLIWIPFFLSYVAIKLNFSLTIFQKMTNIQDVSGIIYSFCAILFVLSLIPKNISDVTFFSNHFYKYIIIYFVFIFNFFILIFALIKKRN